MSFPHPGKTLNLSNLLEPITIGFAAGIFSGAFGLGGGTIATPLLRMFLGTSAHVAVGTTMAVIIPTSIFGAYNYFRKGMVDIKVGKILVLPAMLGVVLGAYLTTFVHDSALMIAFAGLVAFLGVDISFGLVKRLMDLNSKRATSEETASAKEASTPPKPLIIGLVGLATGMMAGFFGVGAGLSWFLVSFTSSRCPSNQPLGPR
jgi:Predicted permeases